MVKWKTIENFQNYKISNYGQAESSKNKSKRILKSRINSGGYVYVNLCTGDGKYKSKMVHILVARAFIKNPKELPQVNHKDGHKINNFYNNLEWVTPKENALHASKMGLLKGRKGQKCNLAKLKEDDVVEIRKLRQNNMSYNKIAQKFPVSRSNIIQICQRMIWKHI